MGKEIVADDFFSNQDPKTWNSSGSADNAMSVVLLQSGREIISNQSPGFLVQTPSISAISLLQWCSLDWVHVPVDTFFVMLFHGLEIHRAEDFISFSSYSVVQSMMDHVNLFTSFKAMHNIQMLYGHISGWYWMCATSTARKESFWRSKWLLYAIEKIVVYLFPQQVDHWDEKSDIDPTQIQLFSCCFF